MNCKEVFAVVLLLTTVKTSCLRPSNRFLRKLRLREANQQADAGSASGNAAFILLPFTDPADTDELASSGAGDAKTCEASLKASLEILKLQVYDECLGVTPVYVKDCCELKYLGFNGRSGFYGVRDELAYCDMETDGGGWMVIARRVSSYKPGGPGRSFRKNWKQYAQGFGVLDRSFWLGLERMHRLTFAQPMELRVDMTWENGTKVFAHYENFYVAGAEDKYRLTVEGYNPKSTVRDSLTYHNGSLFSTYDQDNDKRSNYRSGCANVCPDACGGGWWYRDCWQATFTADDDYLQSVIGWTVTTDPMGAFLILTGQFTHAEMKMRPKEWHCGIRGKEGVYSNVPLI